MKKTRILSFAVAIAGLSACAPNNPKEIALQSIADNAIQSLSCADFQMSVWDSLKDYLLEQKQVPTSLELSAAIKERVLKMVDAYPEITQDQINRLTVDLHALFEVILDESSSGEKVETPQQMLMLITAIDVGDKTTPFRKYMVEKTAKLFAQVNQDIQGMGLACPRPLAGLTADENSVSSLSFEKSRLQALQSGMPLAVFGERWAFTTAYQSCNTTRLPAMTTASPSVDGISIIGKHPDGVGNRRVIGNLTKVQKSHFYIRDEKTYGASCFDVRKNPLIYDYGGKPYATTAASSPIDMFKNNGDGTSVLGIDCSGFVFTSMAAAGLKLKEDRPLKASDAWGWGSSSYVEPQNNGLTCLNKINVTPKESLKAGDIVAVYGHVFLIDSVGGDPFGVRKTRSVSDCPKMDPKNFDFVIAQSSSGKNGIGINHYQGRDYAVEHGGTSLVKYASYACQAYYNNKSYTPSLGDLSIVRHKGTAACTATRVKLVKEECIQDCSMM